jgi:hypothetical protein
MERDFGSGDIAGDRMFLLEECGRSEEALALARVHPAAGTGRLLRVQAGILDRLGRSDDAIALLRPHAASRVIANYLAEMLLRRGELDEALATLRRR